MTRAQQTLALARLPGPHPFQDALRDSPSVQWRDPTTLSPPTPELARRHYRLTLSDVYLSFAGYKPPRDPTHRAIAELAAGDQLEVRAKSDWWELRNYAGVTIATLARKFKPLTDMRCTSATVHAIATWSRDLSDPQVPAAPQERHLGGRNPRTRLRALLIGCSSRSGLMPRCRRWLRNHPGSDEATRRSWTQCPLRSRESD